MTRENTPVKIATKDARHQRILTLLERNEVQSQSELLAMLATEGIAVTQATLSRDLDELRVTKVKSPSGAVVYVVPPEGGDPVPSLQGADSSRARLERVVAELLSSTDHSGNIVILRTPPGAAQYLASTIDHTSVPGIIGTVAGDDTVMVVSRDPKGGAKVANQFAAMAARRGSVAPTASLKRTHDQNQSHGQSVEVKE